MKYLFICLLVTTPAVFAAENQCQSTLSVTPESWFENYQLLEAAADAATTRQSLMKANITYGALGIGAGTADIALKVADGKIVSLIVDADVKIAGVSMDKIKKEVNVTDLSQGRTLGFTMAGGEHDTLVISPLPGFSPLGGRATIRAWNGKYNAQGKPIYSAPETVFIGKNAQGRYGIWKVLGGASTAAQIMKPANKIQSLKINMRGNPFEVKSLYTHSYKIVTL